MCLRLFSFVDILCEGSECFYRDYHDKYIGLEKTIEEFQQSLGSTFSVSVLVSSASRPIIVVSFINKALFCIFKLSRDMVLVHYSLIC